MNRLAPLLLIVFLCGCRTVPLLGASRSQSTREGQDIERVLSGWKAVPTDEQLRQFRDHYKVLSEKSTTFFSLAEQAEEILGGDKSTTGREARFVIRSVAADADHLAREVLLVLIGHQEGNYGAQVLLLRQAHSRSVYTLDTGYTQWLRIRAQGDIKNETWDKLRKVETEWVNLSCQLRAFEQYLKGIDVERIGPQ